MHPLEVTEVRVKLLDGDVDKLLAFCTITLNGCFVVRDLKIIDGPDGPFVAMPSRKLGDRCPDCREKNPFRARYCSECGRKLSSQRAPKDGDGYAKLFADIAHPISVECRQMIEQVVMKAYETERLTAASSDDEDVIVAEDRLPEPTVAKRGRADSGRTRVVPAEPEPENVVPEGGSGADFAAGIL